ncbi:cathepsin B-like [Diorhabda sublineata]|uniref:cathepsin B-like n=1 Tax=Diorhabda sublineata TaxID=1163346 RepID=UPI0024E04C20|nr:cathepsin B-like [Diorhabda sublineata]
MLKIFVSLLLSSSVFGETIDKLHPLSIEFIDAINRQQNTWKAGKNFDENTPMSEIKKLTGSLKSNFKLPIKHHKTDVEIPDSFDSAEQWPQCKDVIGTITDQSACGSCWAVAAASAMSDRRCIKSNGELKVPVSSEDLLACCSFCGLGCNGGFSSMAWLYWKAEGIVTGGLYNSTDGCKSYSMLPCEHHTVVGPRPQCTDYDFSTPSCNKRCDNSALVYNDELTFGDGFPYTLNNAEDIQREILQHGPVEATFNVYEDFLSYKSGVYSYTMGSLIGGHAVRIVGWGVENDLPYWKVANSWNYDWGEEGYFKIVRGRNEVGFESDINAGLANI